MAVWFTGHASLSSRQGRPPGPGRGHKNPKNATVTVVAAATAVAAAAGGALAAGMAAPLPGPAQPPQTGAQPAQTEPGLVQQPALSTGTDSVITDPQVSLPMRFPQA